MPWCLPLSFMLIHVLGPLAPFQGCKSWPCVRVALSPDKVFCITYNVCKPRLSIEAQCRQCRAYWYHWRHRLRLITSLFNLNAKIA